MNNDEIECILKRHNVKVWGSGSKVLLFAHGLACDQKVWRFITPAFESEYKIVVFITWVVVLRTGLLTIRKSIVLYKAMQLIYWTFVRRLNYQML
jgi:hypothetical protein